MTRIIAFLAVFLTPIIASAQTRVSVGTDFSKTSYGINDFEVNFRWNGYSAEVEHEFKKDKLWLISGFSIGATKEGETIFNGTYLTAKLFHTFNTKNVSIIASGGILYGLVGIQFDRSRLRYENNEVVGYQSISMQRNISIPGREAEKAGVLQPVFEVKARKYLNRFFIEARSGVRLAEFSAVDSNYHDSTYRASIVPMPSVGVGIGFTF